MTSLSFYEKTIRTPEYKESLKDSILRNLQNYFNPDKERNERELKENLSKIVEINDKDLYIFAITQYISRKIQLPESLSVKLRYDEGLIKDIVINYIKNNSFPEGFLAEIKKNNPNNYYKILKEIEKIHKDEYNKLPIYDREYKRIPKILLYELKLEQPINQLDEINGGKKSKKRKSRRRNSKVRKSKRRVHRKK